MAIRKTGTVHDGDVFDLNAALRDIASAPNVLIDDDPDLLNDIEWLMRGIEDDV